MISFRSFLWWRNPTFCKVSFGYSNNSRGQTIILFVKISVLTGDEKTPSFIVTTLTITIWLYDSYILHLNWLIEKENVTQKTFYASKKDNVRPPVVKNGYSLRASVCFCKKVCLSMDSNEWSRWMRVGRKWVSFEQKTVFDFLCFERHLENDNKTQRTNCSESKKLTPDCCSIEQC